MLVIGNIKFTAPPPGGPWQRSGGRPFLLLKSRTWILANIIHRGNWSMCTKSATKVIISCLDFNAFWNKRFRLGVSCGSLGILGCKMNFVFVVLANTNDTLIPWQTTVDSIHVPLTVPKQVPKLAEMITPKLFKLCAILTMPMKHPGASRLEYSLNIESPSKSPCGLICLSWRCKLAT